MKRGLGYNLMFNARFERYQCSGSQNLRVLKIFARPKNTGPGKTKDGYRLIGLVPRQNRAVLQTHLDQPAKSSVEQLIDFLVFVERGICTDAKIFNELYMLQFTVLITTELYQTNLNIVMISIIISGRFHRKSYLGLVSMIRRSLKAANPGWS